METKIGPCPLGSECESIKDGVKYVCPWYVKVMGKVPQSDQMVDEWRCSMSWLPMLMIENSQMQRQTGAAVESFRNEMVKDNNKVIRNISQIIAEEQSHALSSDTKS